MDNKYVHEMAFNYCGPLCILNHYLAESEDVTPAAGGAQHSLVGHAEQLGLVTRQDGITEIGKMQSYNLTRVTKMAGRQKGLQQLENAFSFTRVQRAWCRRR